MATRVEFNQGVMSALAVSGSVQAAVLAKAVEAKGIAEGLAAAELAKSKDPAAAAARTDHYEDDFNVRSGNANLTTLRRRASAILENTSDHALAAEWGNKRFPEPWHILKRTKDAMEGG